MFVIDISDTKNYLKSLVSMEHDLEIEYEECLEPNLIGLREFKNDTKIDSGYQNVQKNQLLYKNGNQFIQRLYGSWKTPWIMIFLSTIQVIIIRI